MTRLRSVRVGIAYEGGLDKSYASCLVRRLMLEKGFEISDLDTIKANTVITKMVPVYVTKFVAENRNIMIFLTDSDDGINDKHQIEGQIDTINPAHRLISAIGIPEPNMEGWVLADEDAVKNVLGYDGARPLPYANVKTKDRLKMLHSESSHVGTLDEAKVAILETASFRQMIAHSSSFRTFKDELDNLLNRI